MHIFFRDNFIVKLTIGLKSNSAMHEQFQVWPQIQQILFVVIFQYLIEQYEVPAWNSGKACDILFAALLADFLHFFIKVCNQSGASFWSAGKLNNGRGVHKHNGGKVSV